MIIITIIFKITNAYFQIEKLLFGNLYQTVKMNQFLKKIMKNRRLFFESSNLS